MRASFQEKLCCPIDKNDLKLQVIKKDEKGNIIEGLFSCTKCSRYYPIVQGVPIMSPDEYREKSLEEPILNRWGLTLDANNTKMKLLENPGLPADKNENKASLNDKK